MIHFPEWNHFLSWAQILCRLLYHTRETLDLELVFNTCLIFIYPHRGSLPPRIWNHKLCPIDRVQGASDSAYRTSPFLIASQIHSGQNHSTIN